MRTRPALPFVIALFCCLPGLTFAAALPRKVIRFGVADFEPKGDWSGFLPVTEQFSIESAEADSGTGGQVGMEFLFTDRMGLDLRLLRASHDIHVEGENFPSGTKLGSVTQWPLLAGWNFHIARGRHADLYLEPVLGYVLANDMSTTSALTQWVDLPKIRMHNEFAYGAIAGLDFPLGHFGFSFDVKYLNYDARTDDPAVHSALGKDWAIPINPLVMSAGFVVAW